MIEPNFTLMLWIVFISHIFSGLSRIGLGAAGKEKNAEYGVGDVITGVIILVLMAVVAFS